MLDYPNPTTWSTYVVGRVVEHTHTPLDLKPYTVKEYVRRGILPGRKLGRTWRFLRPELEEAIRRLPKVC